MIRLVRTAWISAVLLASGCEVGGGDGFPDSGPLPDGGRAQDGSAVPIDTGFPNPIEETCTPEGMGSTIGDSCLTDAICDDGCFCNGTEQCEDGVCATGGDPCPDTVECTADVCLEEANRCFHEPQHEMCGNDNACDGTEICDLARGC